jgi:RNA polymerase sigma-70 factor (ECF subfamily)
MLNFYDMEESLLEIIKGCKDGKRNSQEKLFKTYYGKVKSICLRYSNDVNQAEDYLQDAFIKIFSNINKCKIENENSFGAWIKKTTRNNIIDSIRKNKKIYLQENEDVLDYQNFESPESSDKEVYFLESQLGLTEIEIIEEIQKLPLAQRTVFNLFVIENLGHKEISKILGINEGTSKSNLSKAKMNLRKELNKHLNV